MHCNNIKRYHTPNFQKVEKKMKRSGFFIILYIDIVSNGRQLVNISTQLVLCTLNNQFNLEMFLITNNRFRN